MEFEVIQPGSGRLMRAMMDEIKLVSIINSGVRWDETQWKLSPGEIYCCNAHFLFLSQTGDV